MNERGTEYANDKEWVARGGERQWKNNKTGASEEMISESYLATERHKKCHVWIKY